VKKVVLGILVWWGLSVPLGILVGKVLKANREAWERGGPPEPPAWVSQAQRAQQEAQELRASQANQGNGASPDLKVIRGQSGQPDL
jgi:hypothetical protein